MLITAAVSTSAARALDKGGDDATQGASIQRESNARGFLARRHRAANGPCSGRMPPAPCPASAHDATVLVTAIRVAVRPYEAQPIRWGIARLTGVSKRCRHRSSIHSQD